LRDALSDLGQQFPPRLLDLRRPVGPEEFVQGIGDNAEELAKQLARRAIGIVRL
jgi:hypothetical protein